MIALLNSGTHNRNEANEVLPIITGKRDELVNAYTGGSGDDQWVMIDQPESVFNPLANI